MNSARKVHRAKKHKQNRILIIAVSFLLLVIILVTVSAVYFFNPSRKDEQTANTDPAFNAFTTHYLAVMKNLNSSQTKAEMSIQLDPKFNQTDLFTWEASKLTFFQDPGFYEDPFQIMNSGKGICVQWSVLYVSACLALGYQSRLVVAADTTNNWNFIHTWAEDYCNGKWVHVDPSDKVWNNPSRYLGWDWGSAIGSQVKIYAFEDGTFHDVTASYSAH
jgi:hypothetical protein